MATRVTHKEFVSPRLGLFHRIRLVSMCLYGEFLEEEGLPDVYRVRMPIRARQGRRGHCAPVVSLAMYLKESVTATAVVMDMDECTYWIGLLEPPESVWSAAFQDGSDEIIPPALAYTDYAYNHANLRRDRGHAPQQDVLSTCAQATAGKRSGCGSDGVPGCVLTALTVLHKSGNAAAVRFDIVRHGGGLGNRLERGCGGCERWLKQDSPSAAHSPRKRPCHASGASCAVLVMATISLV